MGYANLTRVLILRAKSKKELDLRKKGMRSGAGVVCAIAWASLKEVGAMPSVEFAKGKLSRQTTSPKSPHGFFARSNLNLV